jgi:hypothetical protein
MRRCRRALAIFLALSYLAFGQPAPFSEKWTGTWNLDIGKSTFGLILFPGVPADMTIVRQTLRIERAGEKIRLSGETDVRLSGNTITSQDDTSLSLDGTETSVGPAALAFRRADSSAFEILSKLKVNDREYQEVSRFVFSPDGKTLTETKTQTEKSDRAGNKAKDEIVRSSTTVLVFARQ